MTTETRRTEVTRIDYMAGPVTHSEYYGAIVECLGETALRALLPGTRTPEDWRALLAADEHLNNVPLASWDAKHEAVRGLTARAQGLKAITGSGGWSLADSVCTLKETARRFAEGGEAADAPITLSQFIQGAADIGRPFKFTATRIAERTDNNGGEWGAGSRHWRITITRDGRQMRVYFSQGSAHTEPPTLEDVLDCLASDAAGVANARGFEDWASEYGYDTDSRKAERTYTTCVEQAEALRRMIDDDDMYDRLLFGTERA